LTIEREFIKSLDLDDVIRTFSNEKDRKKELCIDADRRGETSEQLQR